MLDYPLVFILAMTRISSMIWFAPVLGSRTIPVRFKLGLSLLLALTTFPLIQTQQSVLNQEVVFHDFIRLISGELIVGTSLGLGIMIVVAAAQMAGTIISQITGMQIAENFDHQAGGPVTPLSQFFGILSIAAFVLVGGLELIVSSTLDTFELVPIGTALNFDSAPHLIGTLLQQSFILALKGVAPALATLMLSTLVVGWISRSYPHMNLLSVGLSSNLVVMLLAVSLTLGGCVWLFVDDLNHTAISITESFQPSSPDNSQ